MNLTVRFLDVFLLLLTLILLFVLCIQLIRFFFRKISFPKKLALTTGISFALFFSLFIYIQYFFTFDVIDRSMMQEQSFTYNSPNAHYLAKIFYEPYGGAAGGVNVWVEVTDIDADTTKIIYYADAKNYVTLHWQNETSLAVINGNRSITLNVETDIYHESGLACQSILLKGSFDTCYQAD